MKNYYVYYAVNGAIMFSGSCASDQDLEHVQISDGCILAEGAADIFGQYVRDGELLDLLPEQIDIYKSQPWRRREFNFDLMEYPETRTFDQIFLEAKLAKWAEIKASRSDEELKPIWFDGGYFDADLFSQQRISGAVQLALLSGDEFQIEWTLADNSSRVLSKAELIGLGVALGSRTAQIFQYSQTLREQIELAQSVEDVEQISWQFNQ